MSPDPTHFVLFGGKFPDDRLSVAVFDPENEETWLRMRTSDKKTAGATILLSKQQARELMQWLALRLHN